MRPLIDKASVGIKEDRDFVLNLRNDLALSKTPSELDKKKLTEQLIELNKKSLQTGDELQQKYGEGNINIETGEFLKR